MTAELIATVTQDVAERIENVADSEGVDHDELIAAVAARLVEVYLP